MHQGCSAASIYEAVRPVKAHRGSTRRRQISSGLDTLGIEEQRIAGKRYSSRFNEHSCICNTFICPEQEHLILSGPHSIGFWIQQSPRRSSHQTNGFLIKQDPRFLLTIHWRFSAVGLLTKGMDVNQSSSCACPARRRRNCWPGPPGSLQPPFQPRKLRRIMAISPQCARVMHPPWNCCQAYSFDKTSPQELQPQSEPTSLKRISMRADSTAMTEISQLKTVITSYRQSG